MKPENAATLDFQFAQWGEDGDFTPAGGGPPVSITRGFIVDAFAAERQGGFEGHADERVYLVRTRLDKVTPQRGAQVEITHVGSIHLGKVFRFEALDEDDAVTPQWVVLDVTP